MYNDLVTQSPHQQTDAQTEQQLDGVAPLVADPSTTVMSKYLEIGSKKYPNSFGGPWFDQTKPGYILKSNSWSNKHMNIFGCPRVHWTNIWVSADGGKASNMNTNNIRNPFHWNN